MDLNSWFKVTHHTFQTQDSDPCSRVTILLDHSLALLCLNVPVFAGQSSIIMMESMISSDLPTSNLILLTPDLTQGAA